MPNECFNVLKLSVSEDTNIFQFQQDVDNGENDRLNFQKVLPISLNEDELDKLDELDEGRKIYKWKIQNWETKWGAYDTSEWKLDSINFQPTLEYITAWNPATKFYVNISTKFQHFYYEAGWQFTGYEIIQNGNIIEENNPL